MDAYFRQTWVDERLKLGGHYEVMAVHVSMLKKIWKPDTYFINGIVAHLHTMTEPNKLVRIMKNGTILYSMRVTIKASCPMYLHHFPGDEQSCPLHFGSFSFTKDQVQYVWKFGSANSITVDSGMKLSQFDLIGTPTWNETLVTPLGEFSTLKMSFILTRHMGYFLINVYVPCILMVIISWVAFWLNREATADRVSLGITTFLTLTTTSMDSRNDLPKVHYATALDWFVLLCFGFVIGSLLQFTAVHYFTKLGSGEPGQPTSDYSSESDTHWELDEWNRDREAAGKREILRGRRKRRHRNLARRRSRDTSREVSSSRSRERCIGTSSVGKREKSTERGREIDLERRLEEMARERGKRLHDSTLTLRLTSVNPPLYESVITPANPPLPTASSSRHTLRPGGPGPRDNTLSGLDRLHSRSWFWLARCLQGNEKYRRVLRRTAAESGVNSVSYIDKVSRVVFPTAFILLNSLYWIGYTRQESQRRENHHHVNYV